MNRLLIAAVAAAGIIVSPSAALAKKKPELTPLQLQQMQSRDVEAPKNVAFAAVMTVLQDSGYRIGSADKDTGLITGAASTNSKLTWRPFVGFGRGKKTPVVSAFIEDRSPTMSRIRLNFVMSQNSSNQFGGNSDEEPILDPAVYQDAFEKIEQAVFVRQASDAPQAVGPSAEPVVQANPAGGASNQAPATPQ
ncbi:hypothetical protein [Sphingosinicella sp. LY1275]|uniref:hypothetical protein n=1 Tax=Sphingosinicella sp. LY1275 TaxID=3095379 RepID=UPI002ADEB3A3|nr:hypothetical protein [Sphingosinicella sp. LY1275]MEA1013615.1 hypothetical protein [Sphingosinicella sp. LY1275]